MVVISRDAYIRHDIAYVINLPGMACGLCTIISLLTCLGTD